MKTLAADAPRVQVHLAARSLKPLSRYVLPNRSSGRVLGVGAIGAAQYRAEVAKIRTKHRAVSDPRIAKPFQRPLRRERGQPKELQRLIRPLPQSPQRLLDGGADVTQIGRNPGRVDADACKRNCVRARITLGPFAHRELQGDGGVTGTSTPHALAEFCRESGDQRVTRATKSLRTSPPRIQVDVDRNARHDERVIAVAST